MKNPYWQLQFSSSHLIVITPWFGFYVTEFDKDFCSCSIWRGFEFWWQRPKQLLEGQEYFEKKFHFESERINLSQCL